MIILETKRQHNAIVSVSLLYDTTPYSTRLSGYLRAACRKARSLVNPLHNAEMSRNNDGLGHGDVR